MDTKWLWIMSRKTEVFRWKTRRGKITPKNLSWQQRYGKANEHNAAAPRYFWLEQWEKDAIIKFHENNPREGYRRSTFMMLDQNIVAVSPSSVYKDNGFMQPLKPHIY